MAEQKHAFLVTGASSGLGLSIALEALKRGHKVIGSARNVARAKDQHPQFEEAGGKWLELDLTSPETKDVVSRCVEDEEIDILVNNAGYGLYGVFEDMSEQEIRDQMETNFFGTVRVMQAAIPHFRKRRRGTIVTMSSISGLTVTSPSGIMYSTSKFALEGISEGLAMQLAPFNIRVLIVEPGLVRTNWLKGSFITPEKEMTEDYKGTPVDEALNKYPTMHGQQAGDPEKAARIVVDVTTGVCVGANEGMRSCLRLPLGIDAVNFGREYIAKLSREFDLTEEVARSTVFNDG